MGPALPVQRAAAAIVVALVLLLAGCMGGSGMSAQLSPGKGFRLSSDALGGGSAHSTRCGPEGWNETLQGDLALRYAGTDPLRVRVWDATDALVFDATYEGGNKVQEDAQTFSGEPGGWLLRHDVTDQGMFHWPTGDIWISIYCGIDDEERRSWSQRGPA